MLHLMQGKSGLCYYIERPWGNLLVYEAQEFNASDWERLKGRGGVFRQLVLEPLKSTVMAKKVFDFFGAAVVSPFPMEFNPDYPVEELGVDFVDPGIRLLQSHGISALEMIVKDRRFIFTDQQLSLADGEILHKTPSKQGEAKEFIDSLSKPATILTPKYRDKNFLTITNWI